MKLTPKKQHRVKPRVPEEMRMVKISMRMPQWMKEIIDYLSEHSKCTPAQFIRKVLAHYPEIDEADPQRPLLFVSDVKPNSPKAPAPRSRKPRATGRPHHSKKKKS